jgi:flavin reductase (DIM6/NTAB) family NADH-FMN oxidoreductase RutF
MHWSAEELTPARRYGLAIGLVVPRPIAVVGTIGPDGRVNLAPFSYYSMLSSEPFMLGFCPANDEQGGEKDTLRNCKPRWEGGTGVFTVGVATDAIIRRVVACGEPLPYGASEFELAGLTPIPGISVAAPRVAESPATFECETFQVIRFGPGVPSAGNLVIGRVLRVHVDERILDERQRIDPAKLDAVGRMGGTGYARTRDRFDLPVGRGALSHGTGRNPA